MLDQPRMYRWVLMAILAAVCAEIARRQDPYGFRGLFLICAFIFGFAAALLATDWLLHKLADQARIAMELRARTERVLLIEQIARLNDNQLDYMRWITPQALAIPGHPGPTLMYLRVGGADIPYDFIEKFFDLSDDTYLTPVSTWSDGTKQREWAQLLTNHLILTGMASKSAGNRSAKWIDKSAAYSHVGMQQSPRAGLVGDDRRE